LWWLIAEDQDRDEHRKRGQQQHQQPRHQDRPPAGSVEAAGPRERPQSREPRAYTIYPVLLIFGAGWDTSRRKGRDLYGIQDSARLLCGSRRTVIGQGRPWGDQPIVRSDRIVVSLLEFARKPAGVLSLTATREDGVDVQGIDLSCEPGASRRIGRCALR
jgi:hypothetical protein